MGSTNHKSSRSLSSPNIFPSFGSPENRNFHIDKLKQSTMANSITNSKINFKPVQKQKISSMFFKVFNAFSFLNYVRNNC